ncbi:MAG: HAD family hydrolase [Brevinema sp.]
MKHLIIFDLYNTLIIDNAVAERREYCINALWSTIESVGLPIRFGQVRDAYDHVHHLMATEQKGRFSINMFDLAYQFCSKLHINDVTTLKKIYDIWAFSVLQITPSLLPGIKEGLDILKAEGKTLAIISNTGSSPGVALRFLLTNFGIYDHFSDLVFSDEFGLMKPRSMIFQRVLDRCKAKPDESIFIGDHEIYDKQGAEKSGIAYLEMNPSLEFSNVVRDALSL